jgi:hypothetical protein
MNKTITKYDKVCLAVIKEFVEKYFVDKDYKFEDVDYFAIGDELDGVICINDYFFDFRHMAECLRINPTKEQVFGYYDYATEIEFLRNKKPKRLKENIAKINFKTWLKLKPE